jgi:hypothetical protein
VRGLPALLACDRVISVASTDYTEKAAPLVAVWRGRIQNHPSHDDPRMTKPSLLLPLLLSCFDSHKRAGLFVQRSSIFSASFDDGKGSFCGCQWMMYCQSIVQTMAAKVQAENYRLSMDDRVHYQSIVQTMAAKVQAENYRLSMDNRVHYQSIVQNKWWSQDLLDKWSANDKIRACFCGTSQKVIL